MNKIYKKTAALLALINFIALFYLNFAIELPLLAQFVVLPWLAIQSLIIISITNKNSNITVQTKGVSCN